MRTLPGGEGGVLSGAGFAADGKPLWPYQPLPSLAGAPIWRDDRLGRGGGGIDHWNDLAGAVLTAGPVTTGARTAPE